MIKWFKGITVTRESISLRNRVINLFRNLWSDFIVTWEQSPWGIIVSVDSDELLFISKWKLSSMYSNNVTYSLYDREILESSSLYHDSCIFLIIITISNVFGRIYYFKIDNELIIISFVRKRWVNDDSVEINSGLMISLLFSKCFISILIANKVLP